MKIRGRLLRSVPGIGFTVKSGTVEGDLDDKGLVWLDVVSNSRIPGDRDKPRRVGVPVAKFEYVEEWSPTLPAVDKRADVKKLIKAAEQAAKGRGAA